MISRAPFGVATCVGLALATATVAAQKDPFAGFGSLQGRPINLRAQTENDGAVGVVVLNGEYYVSSRGPDAEPPHEIYVYDAQGTLLRDIQQPPLTRFSPWGFRDGCTDGQALAFGFESGIQCVTASAGAPINSFNGQSVPNPIVVPGVAVHRGLALDPNGDGGRGSFWIGDFGADLVEADLQGNVLRTVPPPAGGPQWSIYGLAWDTQGTATPNDDTLWLSSAPNRSCIREFDPRTGQYTGAAIVREQATAAQGGLDGVAGPFGSFSLVGVDQGRIDTLSVYRVDRDSQVPGETEALLLSSVGTGPLTTASPKYFNPIRNVSFAFDLSGDPTLTGQSALLIFNAGTGLPSVPFPGFPELVAQLAPAITFPLAMTGTPVPLTIPTELTVGTQVRMQAVYADLGMRSNFLVPTNQVFWERERIVIEAIGDDAFNGQTTSGFFRITNLGAARIEEITFDWTAATDPELANAEFDTNQGNMADSFENGNSTVPGCRGTYRNNSHITTGLVFDAQNTVLGVPCNPSSNSGWIGTNPGTDPGDYRTLRFRFTNFDQGEVFEFDCDVDLGGASGSGGDGMSGLPVTVRLATGVVGGPTQLVRLPGQNISVAKF